jgi:preprotein translocase subunit SecE
LASGRILLYVTGEARRREAPRREFFWRAAIEPPAAGFDRSGTDNDMTNPFEFIQQVRSEARKVVWPTRRETLVTTGLVLLLVAVTSLFFLVTDEVLRTAVGLVLGFGRTG